MAERKRKNHQTETQNVRFDLLGLELVCLTYSVGMLLSGFQLLPFQAGNKIRLCLFSWLAVLAGGLFCWMFRKYRKYGGVVPAAGAVICFLYYGPARIWLGIESLCNILITEWNQHYEDGLPLVGSGQMQEEVLFAVYMLILLLCITLFWYLAEHNACGRIIALMLFCLIPEIILRQSSSLGTMILLTCTAGTWLLFFQSASRVRRIAWFVLIGMTLSAISVFTGKHQIQMVLQLQKNLGLAVDTLRYGTNTLPEGNLKKACDMQVGEAETLQVTTEQIKPLYFQGFIGAHYENGQWKPLKKASYGGEHWGFLKWLSSQNLDVNAQYAAYQAAGGNEEIPENHVKVENLGASRKYIYTVYSAQKPVDDTTVSDLDLGYRSKALLGSWNYQFVERSQDIPGELCQLDDWAYAPVTEAQQQYLAGEAVYREFVYENYLDLAPELEQQLQTLFADAAGTDKSSIYGMTQEIRKVMESQFYYEVVPQYGGEKDPLLAFLKGNQSGNSAYYASAGVLAFRSFGIPARYAEGYYLGSSQLEGASDGQVKLTSDNAHAWTEVYMDGIGWIPVDFTPGFYYNTYALLRMAQFPQNIRKTAAMEDNGEEAENVTGNAPQPGKQENVLDLYKNDIVSILWGLVLLLLLMAELLLLLLEIRRLVYEHRIRTLPESGAYTQAISSQIERNFRALGLEVRPGWNTEETDQMICKCLPDIRPGTYSRVNTVLEKYIYGDGTLEPEELRLLHYFLIAVRESRKQVGIVKRLRSRYVVWIP